MKTGLLALVLIIIQKEASFGLSCSNSTLHTCMLSVQQSSVVVFPKYISLNSANSVNHDRIQKWYGYQNYYPSGNNYITSTSTNLQVVVENSFTTTLSNAWRYGMSLVTIPLLDVVIIY